MKLNTSLGVWTFALFFVRITCLQSCKPFQVKPEHLNKQLLGYKLFDMIVISHRECAKECMLLGACVSINFITSTKTCEFNSAGSETVPSSDFNKTKGIIFSDISEWPKAMVSGCANNQCDKTQRCLPLGSDSYKCENITCKIPQNADQRVEEHTTVIAGTVRSYEFACPNNMFLSGDKDITCNVNGEWTESKATCQLKVSTIGKACLHTSDCNESGALCKERLCYCSHFFRYDVETRNCTKVCSAMNKTFSVTEGIRIYSRDDRGYGYVASGDECSRLCSEDEDCLSYEVYVNSIGVYCRRSSFTKQMVKDVIPEDIRSDDSCILYEKKCF
ncbi:uncharacterized protein LOC132727173 [Ruditapes philippinarum]|uniref:uncharacterized protein LOC132727173 n=1 Tax=Ruditapes philippinarum TaxID=129788 RepID=UPI00295B94D3|nr:uncharacterized protein LOC132727173 [Ruditapes philippinarum]